MYCGSCLHDNALVAALRRLGHDVVLVPLYTPIRTDEPNQSLPRVFFGGINVFLQQVCPLFRYTPRWLDRLWDTGWMMRLLGRRRAAVDPRGLGPLTVSMLRGREGNQRKELVRLLEWLAQEGPPQIVHLSNALLLGLAPALHEELGVPVVCNLSGEDVFLDGLPSAWRKQAYELLVRQSRHVDRFVALNRYYARHMGQRLHVPLERIEVIPHGLRLEGIPQRRWPERREEFVVGFLARICPEKGLHLLAQALLRYNAQAPALPAVLHCAGYLSSADRNYLRQIQRQFHQAGQAERFQYLGEPDREGKFRLLSQIDLMCLPTVYPESKGLSALEALACGVPLLVPAHGTFPELIEHTGAGWLFEPLNVDSLVQKLNQIFGDPEQLPHRGRQGRLAVEAHYTDHLMARRTAQLYEELGRICPQAQQTQAQECS